jgi:hypothetical protein
MKYSFARSDDNACSCSLWTTDISNSVHSSFSTNLELTSDKISVSTSLLLINLTDSKYVLFEKCMTNSIKSAVFPQEKQKNSPVYLFISPAGVL